MNRTVLFADHISEVENKILKAAKKIDKKIAEQKRAYLGTNNPVLGLSVPQQKEVLKSGYKFSKLELEKQLSIWDSIWKHSKHHESKMQSLHWLTSIKDAKTLLGFWTVIHKWVASVDSWDTSDNLSSVYARLLEEEKNLVYPVLLKWNKSKNAWYRRQSIVSLLYFSNSRRVILPHGQILSLIENLIDDEDKFVQKGVGWSLRECYCVHPVATKNFIRKHATRISAIAFSAAAEKWQPEFTEEIKIKRKKARLK